MSVVESAKAHVKQIVEKVTESVLVAATTESRVQAVTIPRPRLEVMNLFRDAERLSQVLGDVAEVQSVGPDRLRWRFVLDGADGPAWDCVVSVDDESQLRYVDADAANADGGTDGSVGLVLQFRDAPQDRGTEVIARVSAPAPGALTGALAFKLLYRARALLVTGEVPTIKYNPSARDSDR
jgi:uncharacterized membrane protein